MIYEIFRISYTFLYAIEEKYIYIYKYLSHSASIQKNFISKKIKRVKLKPIHETYKSIPPEGSNRVNSSDFILLYHSIRINSYRFNDTFKKRLISHDEKEVGSNDT